MNALVKDVMTTHVIAVRENATFKEMAARLRQHRVSAFPVVDDDNYVIGVVSEADLLPKEAFEADGKGAGILHHREHVKAAGVTAADLMTKPPVTIGPNDFVSQAARVMYSRRVKRLPVVDFEGRLVGIVSRADVLSVYSRPDADIRQDIIEHVILDALLTDPARFTITVKDGIVTAEGTPESAVVGHDMIEGIRHVEGVVAVRDRLSYPPIARPAPVPGPLF
jgi:CBS-domain-containing membrane protein